MVKYIVFGCILLTSCFFVSPRATPPEPYQMTMTESGDGGAKTYVLVERCR